MPFAIPEAVAAFIRQHISSLEEMELLCTLQQDRTRAWTAAELTARLGSTAASIARRLDHLVAGGVVAVEDGHYRLVPAGPGLLADAVAEAYRSHRLSVTALIYDRPDRQLSSFADSFRLRKDDKP